METIREISCTLFPNDNAARIAAYVFLAVSAVMSVITFAVYGIDKGIAVRNGRTSGRNKMRVPEKTLLMLSFFFGSAGAFLAMSVFRHKTRKPKFAVGVPLMFFMWLAVGLMLCVFTNCRGE